MIMTAPLVAARLAPRHMVLRAVEPPIFPAQQDGADEAVVSANPLAYSQRYPQTANDLVLAPEFLLLVVVVVVVVMASAHQEAVLPALSARHPACV